MRVKQVSLQEFKIEDEPIGSDVNGALKQLNISDRAFYQRSLRAFVSYIRFYIEHHARLIFDLKLLEVAEVAQSFGLIHMPKMRELRGRHVRLLASIDTATISYKDPVKEKQRQESLKNKESGQGTKRPLNKAKDKTNPKHAKKEQRREREMEFDRDESDNDWLEYKRERKAEKRKPA